MLLKLNVNITDMKKDDFMKKDTTNKVADKYESPVIQVEEIVVERGFAVSPVTSGPPVMGAKNVNEQSW